MNNIELNSILFYADFLSLKKTSLPVTDNCKYFFIYGTPINSAYLLNLEPIYDPNNEFLIQAFLEFNLVKELYSEDAAMSFIEEISFIKASGMVDAERMLSCIHMFSTKTERKQAFREYRQWKSNNKPTHQVLDENGNPQETECTTYFKHAEIAFERRGIPQSLVPV